MIKLFRRIRQKLLSERKFSKYVFYAIGEIALVVIGILIALQINNWNEGRKNDLKEQTLLLGLKEEFQTNLKRVNEQINRNNRNLENAIKLADLMGPNNPSISDSLFADILTKVVSGELQFRPSAGFINQIINAGSLDVFKSGDIKAFLAGWSGELQKVKYQEEIEHGRIRIGILEYLVEDSNLRRLMVDSYGDGFGFGQTNFRGSNLDLLKSEKFESYLVMFIATGRYLNSGYYEPLEKSIQQFLSIIDDEMRENND